MPLEHPLIVPAIRLDQDPKAEIALALERASKPWLAGFILFGGKAEQVAQLTADLRHEADRPIFISSDMERGAGQQVAGLTRLPDLGLIGLAGGWMDALRLGQAVAHEARSVGIDVIFGPCLDVRSNVNNPILGQRSFGFDPWRVAELGTAYAAGIQVGGALPVVKHFPGHGATSEDSHESIPIVHDPVHVLEGRDLVPFEHALATRYCPAFMTAHVVYPALDARRVIASFSPQIVARGRALASVGAQDAPEDGRVLVFTDAMLMAGATVPGGEPEAAALSLAAGCDMLLYPAEPEAVAAELAVSEADAARVAENLATFLRRAAEAAARVTEDSLPTPEEVRREHLELEASGLADRVLAMSGHFGSLNPDLLILIDDDGMEARGDVLAAAAEAHGTPVLRITGPDADLPELPTWPPEGQYGARAQIVVFASARAWKGSSGASERCRALVQTLEEALPNPSPIPTHTLWCAPRPGVIGDPYLPGTGPHLEAAIARHIFSSRDPAADESS